MTEQMNVPKLRFGEFDGNWQELYLADVATIQAGFAYKSIDMSQSPKDYQLIKMSNVYQNELRLDRNPAYWDKVSKSDARFLMKSGDIVLTLTGTVGKTDFGYTAQIPCDGKFLLNQRLVYLRSIDGVSDPKFLLSKLRTSRFYYKFFAEAKGGTGNQANVGMSELAKIKLSYPLYPEQQKIASFLSKVDEKIMLLTEKKDKLTEYKKGVMQQLFNGSFQEQDGQLTFIPPTLRFKADDGSEFPDWEEKTMVSLFPQIRNGFVGTATPFYASSDNGVKYLQGKNIKKNRIDDSGLIYVNNTFHVKNTKSQLKVDDIVMVQSGHVGECARITKEFDGANCHALLVASPNLEKVNSSYFVYYFYSPIGKAQTHKITTGNTIKHILGSDLKDIKVNAPSLSEQTKIASFLSTIDQKIDLANSQLDKAKEWKKGLLQQMFV
ncbi:restriction endonuclease subunit S [Photobacterium leiognathi]|uniref:restriction endonuclease subunit S n=1 Tax=Photobacterium leiognathi TaxID=553611 RepID=UPI000D17359A|nr:restriction endonuclease subunit S [Photobacterium leiognathi]PSW41147.1 restriction endonuclease subunit S [Photobacterium leiognathi subsp. mandapamensis]